MLSVPSPSTAEWTLGNQVRNRPRKRVNSNQTNTIDKYLERQGGLRVVVALPFLVGHGEEVHSTLWGIQNTRYQRLIAKVSELCTLWLRLMFKHSRVLHRPRNRILRS
jgi:hypothetical protein